MEIKTSHFFACLDRLRLIQRWSLMRNIEKENLAEHSLQVAFVAQALAIIKNKFFGGKVNPERIAVMAMYHDTSEIFTGDLPTPIKYFNPEITQAYKQIESAAELHLISLLPQELQEDFAPYLDSETFSEEEKHLVKQADLICAYVKAQFELDNGNQEFKTAKARLETLMQQWHSQEMDYFLQVFMPSFGRSLDEIALNPIEINSSSSIINKIEKNIMKENTTNPIYELFEFTPKYEDYEDYEYADKVQIIVQGDFGRNILSGLSFPKMESLIIDYLEENAPVKIRQGVDVVMVISEDFESLEISPSGYKSEMLFFIGGVRPNSMGMIQRYQDHYIVHCQAIEEYRSFIFMIVNMSLGSSYTSIDVADLKSCFSERTTYGIIAHCYKAGSVDSNRVEIVAKSVINNLVEQSSVNLYQSESCLISIYTDDPSFNEYHQICDILHQQVVSDDNTIVLGLYCDRNLKGISVSAIVMFG